MDMAGTIFCRKRGRRMTRAELPERIETERLVLRVRTVADAEDIHAYASLPEVAYPAAFHPVKSLEDEIYYLEHILPERNEKNNLPAGYGILAFKELGLHKIEMTCFGYNAQSQRVAEKLGFTLEARIRERKDAQGNRCDSLIYGLLRSEWEARS